MAKTMIKADVHIPEQHHIRGTDAQVTFFKIKENIDQFPQEKTTPIYLYCKSGPMANWAARTLFDLGYKRVYNLTGGVQAWKQAGFPME